MTAIYVPSIQVALQDFIPCMAQQLANHIANRLSEKLESSGSAHINYEQDVIQSQTSDDM